MMAAMSVNGLIAREKEGGKSWHSQEDWNMFRAKAAEIGNTIIGWKTYEAIRQQGRLLDDIKLRVVVTHHQPTDSLPNTVFTSADPHRILNLVAEQGFDRVLIAGGSEIYSMFLREKLIDEIYLTIEPVVLGRGIPLFAPNEEFEKGLKLLEIKKLNQDTIQLHYQVLQ